MRVIWEQTLGAVAGVPFKAQNVDMPPCWNIRRAAGELTLTFQLQDGSKFELTRSVGQRAQESANIVSFQVASTVANDDVEIVFSDTLELDWPVLTADGKLPVEGSFAVAPSPALMTYNPGVIPSSDVPLQTLDGISLAVAGVNAFAANTFIADSFDTRQYGMAKIVVNAGAVGAGLLFTSFGYPVPIYDFEGRLVSINGVLTLTANFSVGSIYYIDLRSTTDLTSAVSSGGGFAYNIFFSPDWAPPTPGKIRISNNLAFGFANDTVIVAGAASAKTFADVFKTVRNGAGNTRPDSMTVRLKLTDNGPGAGGSLLQLSLRQKFADGTSGLVLGVQNIVSIPNGGAAWVQFTFTLGSFTADTYNPATGAVIAARQTLTIPVMDIYDWDFILTNFAGSNDMTLNRAEVLLGWK